MAKEMTFELASEKFAELIAEGYSQADAYRITHPGCKTTNAWTVRKNAYTFAHDPRVMAKIEAAREDMRERHKAYADTLIDHLQEEVESCWKDNRTLAPVVKQVDMLGRFLGMDRKKLEISARVGAMDEQEKDDRLNFLAEKQLEGRG